MAKKSEDRVAAVRYVQKASIEEVGQVILEAGPKRAAEILVWLFAHAPEEVARRAQNLEKNLSADGFARSALGAFFERLTS